ncbi:MAG: hypothetical protein C4532_00135 [Candidatus Abyssobacteria bacterium SURF_17]|uniref:Uncharacterized protein n=1 Tax=Candidatus Abyssobacteria bacterium SURF_17 TaxID=2093361 RepID=A0A419FA32_9BACT|nr:MAG: hypothetical protein C4532_00135 [Candidatus Abyssubacteria bacterium SURF_17]
MHNPLSFKQAEKKAGASRYQSRTPLSHHEIDASYSLEVFSRQEAMRHRSSFVRQVFAASLMWAQALYGHLFIP